MTGNVSALPLRPYQSEALDAIQAAARRGVRRQLTVMPTGAGKTVTFAHGIIRTGGRALVLAHRDELIRQAADKIRQIAPGLDVGVVKAEEDDSHAQVVVGSVQTLSRPSRLDRIGKDFSLVIVDEAHHATATTYLGILDQLGSFTDDGPLTVGFTATAGRADGVGLGHVWEEIVYQRGILQMIAEDYLVDVRGLAVTSDLDMGRVHTRGGDFVESELGNELERSGAIEAAALAYRRYAQDRPGIAFTPTVETARALAQELNTRSITAETVHGQMGRDERRAVLARLHTGQTQVVTNCAVLTEGFDEPKVSCVLLARPTKSTTLFVQMVGRALRRHPGKQDALVLDVAGTTNINGLATISDLAGLPPGKVKPNESLAEAAERMAKEKTPPAVVRTLNAQHVDLFKRSALRWLPVGPAHVLPAGTAKIYLIPAGDDRWDVVEHPKQAQPKVASGGLNLELAMGVGEEIARSRNLKLALAETKWRNKPVSQAQRSALTSMGYGDRLTQIHTSGAASDLMTQHSAAGTIRRLMRRTERNTA